MGVFASFLLGDSEFALDVSKVQEVVRRPAEVLKLPSQPSYLQGVFTLRGTVIPLLGTGKLLGIDSDADGPEARIAIISHQGLRIGLACDETGRVLRPRGTELSTVEYTEGSDRPLTTAILNLPDGLLSVIDLDQLVALKNVPHCRDQEATSGGKWNAKRLRRRCITFRVASLKMAFPITDIHEIVVPRRIERSPVQDGLSLGVMRIRQRVVPVIRFAQLLDHGSSPSEEVGASTGEADSRVIVLAIGEHHVGLQVDSVDAIEIYTEDQCMPVPSLSSRHLGMCRACVDLGDRGHVFLLDSQRVPRRDALEKLTQIYSDMFKAEADRASERLDRQNNDRVTYLWFSAGRDFAVPMSEIREIVEVRTGLLEVPGAPSHVSGMFNLRGNMVTVVDLRSILGFGDRSYDEDQPVRVVVSQLGHGHVGLLVEDVRSILHVSSRERMPLPTLVQSALPPALREDVREVLHVNDGAGGTLGLLALNVQRVFERMEQAATPPSRRLARV